jgi:hypothetical protein
VTVRRLPLALLGAALTLFVVVGPADSSASLASDAAHGAAAAGHLTEALLVAAHPRATGQLPPAVAVHPLALPVDRARWAVAHADHSTKPATVTAPAAIRGPPA